MKKVAVKQLATKRSQSEQIAFLTKSMERIAALAASLLDEERPLAVVLRGPDNVATPELTYWASIAYARGSPELDASKRSSGSGTTPAAALLKLEETLTAKAVAEISRMEDALQAAGEARALARIIKR